MHRVTRVINHDLPTLELGLWVSKATLNDISLISQHSVHNCSVHTLNVKSPAEIDYRSNNFNKFKN